ncbi:hypothetical protein GCM10027515_01460 [Schumannella luteola]|uniref:LCP family protein required for cell wall assembly n=1 Tax=Schumannella luteola TaxID=472059 RepID=A0A852YBQ2_9MICO|nr:LCP family protein required for cell wall assembly [Schumannella luteola]TPX04298.1 LytR family transcriptional regulator [Schumannella luteola]
MTSVTPVRYPDLRSESLMTRRAWWLVVLNVLIPGSAQVLAGNRRLGRFALGADLVFWAVGVLLIAGLLVARSTVVTIVTNPIVLWIIVVALVFYALLWVICTLDTLRLVRFVRVHRVAGTIAALFSVAALVITGGGALYGAWNAGITAGVLGTVFGDGNIADPVDGRYNILLLGGDAGADRVGLRPDSISLVSIDASTGQTSIIGIPRNLEKVPFPAKSPMAKQFPDGWSCADCLINALYTYGEEHPDLYPKAKSEGSSPGIEATSDGVEAVTGLKVQYYAMIDMNGFSQLIDALGGIDIDVKTRLPIGGGQDSQGRPTGVKKWIEVGQQHMDGNTALWYARSRHADDDYHRMARQREVQTAMLKQFTPANVLTKFQAIATAGGNIVETDIPQPMLGKFVDLADLSRKQKITDLELVPPQVETWDPDYDAIREMVAGVTKVASASPTPNG